MVLFRLWGMDSRFAVQNTGLGIFFVVRGMGAEMLVPKPQNSNEVCKRFALSWGPLIADGILLSIYNPLKTSHFGLVRHIFVYES